MSLTLVSAKCGEGLDYCFLTLLRGNNFFFDMKAQKVRDLDENELRTQLRDMEEQFFRLQFQMNMGQTDGLKKLRGMK